MATGRPRWPAAADEFLGDALALRVAPLQAADDLQRLVFADRPAPLVFGAIEHRDRRHEVHRLDLGSRGQSQDFDRSGDVGRFEDLVGINEVHVGAVVIDGIDRRRQGIEILRRQPQQRLRQVSAHRDHPPRGFRRIRDRTAGGWRRSSSSLPPRSGADQAIHVRAGLLEQFPEEIRAQESRGAGEQDPRRISVPAAASRRSREWPDRARFRRPSPPLRRKDPLPA